MRVRANVNNETQMRVITHYPLLVYLQDICVVAQTMSRIFYTVKWLNDQYWGLSD